MTLSPKSSCLQDDDQIRLVDLAEAFDPMSRLEFESICRAPKRAPSVVLLRGETGSGKGYYARIIHKILRGELGGEFLTVMCPSTPTNLFESELFGHEAGAFTGALGTKIGVFEAAKNGTVFLDEVSEVPIHVQAKLLGVLGEEREYQRIGSARPRKHDALVICATNLDLRRAIQGGNFRHDLFYRISKCALGLLPLRERASQISALAATFLEQLARNSLTEPFSLDNGAVATLKSYPWPGNVRQLHTVLESAARVVAGRVITKEVLERILGREESHLFAQPGVICRSGKPTRADAFAALEDWGGNRSKAALQLGVTLRVFNRILTKQ